MRTLWKWRLFYKPFRITKNSCRKVSLKFNLPCVIRSFHFIYTNENNYTGSENLVLWRRFNELNVKIERLSRFLHFFLTKLTLIGLMSPSLLTTIGNYFIYDLGTESYYFSCPLWFVMKMLIKNDNACSI